MRDIPPRDCLKHQSGEGKLRLFRRQSSSGVEQRTHKPLVGGSNPSSGTIRMLRPGKPGTHGAASAANLALAFRGGPNHPFLVAEGCYRACRAVNVCMSTSSESKPDRIELDLDLQLLPAWAQKPSGENKYAKFEGRDESRSPRRGSQFSRDEQRRPRPEFRRERPQEGRQERRGPGPGPGPREPFRREERRERIAPRVEIGITLLPEEKGVESLARQIHLTGRAYPLFDIAALVLKKPERYQVRFNVLKNAEGKVFQPLFVCGLDDTVWLSEQEAISHALTKHFATFYQAERVASDPPKGTYTFVGQCGLSGTILGPPNYHDYQNKLRQLHGDRFSHMPFDVFKSRIKIVRDEAVVKKWIDDQSWKIEYVCLNVPESLKLGTREEVEKHFRASHLPNVIKSEEAHSLNGTAALNLPDRPLQYAVRRALDDQTRFPLKVVNVLSQQFAGHGLQFFKVNKTVTHVAVARPHYLDLEATPVSESIKRIVDFINVTPQCSRRKLLESLAPGTPVLAGGEKEKKPQDETAAPSPEAAALVSDLHWLIHQGHVIEFSNGLIETAKKPILRPAKVEPQLSRASGAQPTPVESGQPETAKAVQDDSPSPQEAQQELPSECEAKESVPASGGQSAANPESATAEPEPGHGLAVAEISEPSTSSRAEEKPSL